MWELLQDSNSNPSVSGNGQIMNVESSIYDENSVSNSVGVQCELGNETYANVCTDSFNVSSRNCDLDSSFSISDISTTAKDDSESESDSVRILKNILFFNCISSKY